MLPPPGPARLVFGTALVVAAIAFAIAAGLIWVDRSTRQQTTADWLERIQAQATVAAEADGTVCIDYSIEDVWALVGALDLGETGYAFVITDRATFVAHPRREYPRQGLTLYDIADRLGDPVLRRLAGRATDLQSGAIAHSNELTGQDSWIFYGPIEAPKWSLAVVAFTAEIPLDLGEHKRRLPQRLHAHGAAREPLLPLPRQPHPQVAVLAAAARGLLRGHGVRLPLTGTVGAFPPMSVGW